jgi:hypothetical protein
MPLVLVPHFNDLSSLGEKLKEMTIQLADRKAERDKERRIDRSKERLALIAALEAVLPKIEEIQFAAKQEVLYCRHFKDTLAKRNHPLKAAGMLRCA